MGTKTITLTQGKVAIVDEADYGWLTCHRWQAHWNPRSKTWYASRRDGTWMHRAILDAPPGVQVDHWDHDGLNNTRSNLRLVTPTQNAQNQRKRRQARHSTTPYSRFKGVHWFKASAQWGATIRVNGRRIFLGLHVDEAMAARVYDAAAIEYFGEFAHLNFPNESVLRKL